MFFTALSIMTLILSFLLGFYVYTNNKKGLINKTFIFLIFSAMAWIFSNLMTDISNNISMIELWSKVAMVGPLFFSYFFYKFSLVFPEEKKQKRSRIYEITIFIILLVLLALSPSDLNVSEVYVGDGGVPEVIPGPLYPAALIFFVYLMIWGVRNLFIGYERLSALEKLQIQYVSLGIVVSVLLGVITNVILPIIGISQFVNLGPYFLLIFIFFTFYAIIKFKMFDIKIIVTQLLVFGLWLFVFFRFLFDDNKLDRYLDSGLLVVLIVIGIFLIRSVIHEVSQREKIQLLATDLQKANDRLTELDRQKSEFVSFATHQLRAPLTAMKGYASLILEGDMGAITAETRQAISRIFESSNTLTSIVDDYLNVTRIELGSMKYAFETVELKTLINDTIGELKPNIDKATNVKFTFTAENSGGDYRITADRDKLKQVIANLIDNSIKYTPSGSVTTTLTFDRNRHKFIFALKDTGIGIAPETLPHLFNKFSRASNANKTNIKGTGLGLFVAKEIITAHHATITAESPGEGKGSTFIVEFEPFAKA